MIAHLLMLASSTRLASSSTPIALAAGLLLAPASAALADEDEASLHAQVALGLASVGDPRAGDATDVADFLGVSARGTYATSDYFAYELQLSWNQLSRSARFELDPARPGQAADESRGALIRRLGWARLDAGITGRFGVQYIPTVHASLGAQVRVGGDAAYSASGWNVDPQSRYLALDLVTTVGVGFDWRPPADGDPWVVGALISAQRSLVSTEAPYLAASVLVHVAYYFPWFPGVG